MTRWGLQVTSLALSLLVGCDGGETVTEPEPCVTGDVMERACEAEGEVQRRTCGADGSWSEWTDCELAVAPGACTPGNIETSPCDDEECQERTRTCDAEGSWSEWTGCEPALRCSICPDGAVEWEGCGDCRARRHECGDDNLWEPWSECEEQSFAEVCDGFDNDCNGEVDDGGVCQGCALAQTGETEPLSPGLVGGLTPTDDGFALLTRPETLEADEPFTLHQVDVTGRLTGPPLPLELPPEIESLIDNTWPPLSSMSWTGSEYMLFTAYPSGDVLAGPEREIWRVRISTAGEVTEAAPMAALPSAEGRARRIDAIGAVVNRDSGRIGVVVEGYDWNQDTGDDMVQIFAMATADLDGVSSGDFVDLTAAAPCVDLDGVFATDEGFMVLCKDEERQRILVPTDLTGAPQVEGFATPPEIAAAEGRALAFTERSDGVLALLITERGSDRVTATVSLLDAAGGLVEQVELPTLAGSSMSTWSAVLVGGELGLLVEDDGLLMLARYDWEGELIDEPIVLKDLTGEREVDIRSATLRSAPGSLWAAAWQDTQNLSPQIRLNLAAPIDCDNGCDEAALCEPGATETRACGTEVGACELGSQQRECLEGCRWGLWSSCEAAVWPELEDNELCFDEIDNNCNDLVDMDEASCNVCDEDPTFWLCDFCSGWRWADACACLDGSGTDYGVPCDCVLAGDTECNCTVTTDLWYCEQY